MERFLTPQSRNRGANQKSLGSQHSDQEAAVNNIMVGLGMEDTLTLPLSHSESSMLLNSNESAEGKPTVETDSSSLSQENSLRHIALFFKVVDNNKATCTKCSKTLKILQGTTSYLKIHFQRYHPGQVHDPMAAFESASKRSSHKSSQNVATTRRQASIEESFKEKFSQKYLDLYFRSFIGCMKSASDTDNKHNKALWTYACPQFKVPSR